VPVVNPTNTPYAGNGFFRIDGRNQEELYLHEAAVTRVPNSEGEAEEMAIIFSATLSAAPQEAAKPSKNAPSSIK
jgi:hypothetical protein